MYCLDFPAVKHIIKYILLFLGLREERKTKRLIAILAVVLGISSLPCLAACPTADLNGNCFSLIKCSKSYSVKYYGFSNFNLYIQAKY